MENLEKRAEITKKEFKKLPLEEQNAYLKRVEVDNTHMERSFGSKDFQKKKKALKVVKANRKANRVK